MWNQCVYLICSVLLVLVRTLAAGMQLPNKDQMKNIIAITDVMTI